MFRSLCGGTSSGACLSGHQLGSNRPQQVGRPRLGETIQGTLQEPGRVGGLSRQCGNLQRTLLGGVLLQVEELTDAVELEALVECLLDRAALAHACALPFFQRNPEAVDPLARLPWFTAELRQEAAAIDLQVSG